MYYDELKRRKIKEEKYMNNKISFTTTKKNWIIASTIITIILVIVLAYNPIKNKLNPTLLYNIIMVI